MRLLVLAAAMTMAGGAALAQPAAAPSLPRVLSDYSTPDITPGLCRNVSPGETQCVIPAMTAGRYLIEATGTSTATATDAQQQVTIIIGEGGNCQASSSKGNWPVGTPKTLKYNCVVTLLTDRTLTVTVKYDDLKATKDPKGPTLAIRRQSWGGVLQVSPGQGSQQ